MPRMTYYDRNEAQIRSLQPGLRNLVRYGLYRASRIGEDVLVVQGFRTQQEQNKEYLEGSSDVTYPYSFHNHGVAFDFVPVIFGTFAVKWAATSRYQKVANIFGVLGFEWGGVWTRLRDRPHLQFRDGKTITDFINGYQVNGDHFKPMLEDAYALEKQQLTNALKFAKGARRAQIRGEIRIVDDLIEML